MVATAQVLCNGLTVGHWGSRKHILFRFEGPLSVAEGMVPFRVEQMTVLAPTVDAFVPGRTYRVTIEEVR